ncbi:MAG: purine-nucleoside phosphorylase [Oscillospiraceae bacterium]|jgi:purine-nucleoside phosphorylase|nr:purine-nucleoside phosphorylase [Oscillospiraceae bacterium]
MTPHNSAKLGEIAKTVLMPGDPLRSKYIAENFFSDAKLVNNIRGVQGYTGTYKGTAVSVMSSGIGMPSMGIYSYELYKFYEVENIIRIGTAGALIADLPLGYVILGLAAYTDSNYSKSQFGLHPSAAASYSLLRETDERAKALAINVRIGNLFTTDVYYDDSDAAMTFARLGAIAVEMEAYSLYLNALQARRNALAVCTVSNSLLTGEEMDPKLRENSLNDMITLALETAVIL